MADTDGCRAIQSFLRLITNAAYAKQSQRSASQTKKIGWVTAIQTISNRCLVELSTRRIVSAGIVKASEGANGFLSWD